jgi:hypothetical protein
MFGGVPRAQMFWRVHNYDLKKKTYCRLAFSRNNNYDLKIKKVQWFGGCIITSGKKAQLSGRQWEWLGGFHKLGYFGGEVSIGDTREHPLGVYLEMNHCISILLKLNAII